MRPGALHGRCSEGTGAVSSPVMQPTVYVETSVVSYLAADPSTNIIVAGNQAMTRAWWSHRSRYQLVVSALVVAEAERGNPDVAAKRLQFLDGIPAVDITSEAGDLSEKLFARGGPLPAKATDDAVHIAAAAVNGVQYLLTWNCKHLANAAIRPKVEQQVRLAGYEPPTICTPQELLDV